MTAENEPTLTDAVTAALGSLEKTPKDGGAVRLALVYAEEIDRDGTQLSKLGPGLLSVLEALALTPRARAALLSKGVRNDSDNTEHGDDCRCLPCQRQRRGVRRDRASTVDTPVG